MGRFARVEFLFQQHDLRYIVLVRCSINPLSV